MVGKSLEGGGVDELSAFVHCFEGGEFSDGGFSCTRGGTHHDAFASVNMLDGFFLESIQGVGEHLLVDVKNIAISGFGCGRHHN